MNAVHDLNLLRVLDALLEEKGVTRAAARLGITQSAVSHALARLREALGDPLFVRTPSGMVPTPRAQRIAGPLREALAGVERALGEEPAMFDPSRARRAFTISTADYAGFLLLPGVMSRMEREGPFVDLVVVPSTDEPIEPLESGAIDLCIGLKKHARAGVRMQHLVSDRFAVIVRRDHPLVGRRMTLDDYVSLSHVLISPHGKGKTRGFADDALAELGRSRRVALVLPHFLVAPHVIAASDMVITLASRVADRFAAQLGLRVLEPPIELGSFELYQLWHERAHRDPGHVWMRRMIAEVARDI